MSADGILAGIATHTARGILPEGPSAASAVGGLFVIEAESETKIGGTSHVQPEWRPRLRPRRRPQKEAQKGQKVTAPNPATTLWLDRHSLSPSYGSPEVRGGSDRIPPLLLYRREVTDGIRQEIRQWRSRQDHGHQDRQPRQARPWTQTPLRHERHPRQGSRQSAENGAEGGLA